MAAATTMPSNVGRKKKIHPFHIFKYVFLILASIISIFPFLWMIICATNDAVDINRGTVTFGTSLFKNLGLKCSAPKIGTESLISCSSR